MGGDGPLDATQVVLLGTGTPNAEPERSGPSVAVVVCGRPYVVDMGPGIVRRAQAAYQAGVSGLAVEKLGWAFVTHLHSDHTVGYADLILTPWVLGREEPLRAFGPPGIAGMTRHLLAAYEQDVRERICGLEPANERGCGAVAREVEPGLVYQDAQVRVEAFAVRHGSWPAYGYRFDTPERSIVVSGDTAPVDTVVEMSRGCDILVHEVYSEAGFRSLPPAWQRYHAQVHTSASELASMASRAEPGLLILYHQLYWGVAEQDLLCEVRERYDGRVVSGRDLEIY